MCTSTREPRITNQSIGTARKISVDIDATPDLLLLNQQKLHIMQCRYGSLSLTFVNDVNIHANI